MIRLLIALLSILIVGCTGNIVSRNLTKEEASALNKDFDGIIVPTKGMFYEHSETTIRKDEKGNIIGWAVETDRTKKCFPVKMQKIVSMTDYNNQRLISYDHGILESYKFGATLAADGTLASITTEATPDRGETLLNVTSAAGNVAKLAAGADVHPPGDTTPACNDGNAIIGYTRYIMP